MVDSQRRLILGYGEKYIQPVTKPTQGRAPEPARTYDEARQILMTGVQTALSNFSSLASPKRLPNEAVFCLRLHPDATAKSYDPNALFQDVPELRKVGSRTYRESIKNVAASSRIEKLALKNVGEVNGRLVFVQSSVAGFERFLEQLDRPESQVRKQVREEIRRFERFDTLRMDEQLLGFGPDWKGGRVELVFHPSRISEERQMSFITGLFGNIGTKFNQRSARFYPSGPTFVSCQLNREALMALAEANPLRAAHPLVFSGVSDLRDAPVSKAPKPPASTTRSTIKVGMFDGGVDPTVTLLQGHVEEDTSLAIATAPDSRCVDHGTAVAGAILYGELNPFSSETRLPAPPVYVVSIRALPTSDPTDLDLYEAIDVVERAVPVRKDIRVFNLSFGPKGPIEDDTLSRFTWVLDSLAATHKVTFFVAVGNDGDKAGLDRIQSPSDLVNGVGVGAFTKINGGRIVAPYSCRGPGRECGKIKPDVSAFGGCDQSPIHLVSTKMGKKVLAWGTSFASPLAARLGAQASESFDRSSALLARALLVHSASHPLLAPDHLLGHGCIADSIDEVLMCEEGAVTIVFQGAILPGKIIQLPIPFPKNIVIPGKVVTTWTVAGLPPVDPNHPGDYTSCCLEDTFYPHSLRFKFSPPGGNQKGAKTLHLKDDEDEVKSLIGKGWKKSSFPDSETGNTYRSETDRRALDCKWESIVRREKSKFVASVHEPFLTLHAIGRNGASERFDYVVVVTVQTPKFTGDLYTEIRKYYPALAPIRVRTEAETRIQIQN